MTTSVSSDPLEEYNSRLQQRKTQVAEFSQQDDRFSMFRGITFLAGVAILFLAWGQGAISPQWVFLPILVFVVLVIVHGRIALRLEQARRAVRYYEQALARLHHQWQDAGATGERYLDPAHFYSGDLDLFGRGSLFQLISTARTRLGEDELARWLSEAGTVEQIQERHEALAELRNSLDLREQIAMLGDEVHEELDQNALRNWTEIPGQIFHPAIRIVALILSVIATITLIAWLGFGKDRVYFVITLAIQILFLFRFRIQIMETVRTASDTGSGLKILAEVLSVVEQHRFESPLLQRITGQLETEGHPPSWHITRLHKLIQWLSNSTQNQFFAPIAFLWCLPIHLMHAIESWRLHAGKHIPAWLNAVGEFEALSSFAGFAYEHPDYPFPEVIEAGPEFHAVQMGHPLLPPAECVRNDLSLGNELRLLLVSGSNMSGKSTLLRTLGVNSVLALAGAPVNAKELRLSPIQLGTAMRIQDSLQDGKSLFYAVISRLKTVVELTGGKRPLLFLLDEILQGTNSHDRRVGAEGIIRNLVKQGAIGLVTTHDLALTEIVPSLKEAAINVHFEDQLVLGKMKFDYQLRPGVVQKSNALELMRMVGLQIDPEEEDVKSVRVRPE